MMKTVGLVVILVLVLVAIFLLLREVNCWYWKINERISLLNEQNNLLKKLVSNSSVKEKMEVKANSERNSATQIGKLVEKQGDDNTSIEGNLSTEATDSLVQNSMTGVPAGILDKLSPAKKYKLERLIEEMENSDIIVYHDNTVKLLDKERWDGIVSSGASAKYEIIYTKKLS